jgi:hypothetical protein
VPTLSSGYPVARIRHVCMSCHGVIHEGHRYYTWKGTSSDGVWPGIATLKECARCAERHGRPVPSSEPTGEARNDD